MSAQHTPGRPKVFRRGNYLLGGPDIPKEEFWTWVVEWPNGSDSYMPDEETARRCALAPEAVEALREMLSSADYSDGVSLTGRPGFVGTDMRARARSILNRLDGKAS